MEVKKNFKRIGLWLSLGFLVLSIIFIVRVMISPVSVGVLMDIALSGVNSRFPNLVLNFDKSEVVVNSDENSLDLRLTGVSISLKDEPMQANIPEVSMAFSMQGLSQFTLAPSRIDLVGIHMNYAWQADQLVKRISESLKPDLVEGEETPFSQGLTLEEGESESGITALIARMLSEPDEVGPLGFLKRLRIRDASFVMTEINSGTQWSFPGTMFTINRGSFGTNIDVQLPFLNEGKEASLSFKLEAQPSGQQLAVFEFNNVHMANLAASVGLGRPFDVLNLPIFGSISAVLERGQDVVALNYDLSSGFGLVNLPELYEKPLKIEALAVEGSYVPDEARLTIGSFFSAVRGGEVTAEGRILLPIGEQKVDANFVMKVTNLQVDDLPRLWPAQFGTAGHTWVADNLESGLITNGTLNFDIRPEDEGLPLKPDHYFNAEFQFDQLTAHYLRPMPSIEGAQGRGYVNTNNLEIYLESGQINQINVGSSRVYLYDFGVAEKADIEIQASAGIPDIFNLLSYAPLSLPQRYGINAARFGGNADAMVTLKFPLISELTFDDVALSVSANGHNVSVEGVMKDGGLSDGEITLSINNTGLTGRGKVAINHVPLDLVWRQSFLEDEINLPTVYELSGVLSSEDVTRLGVPVGDFVGDDIELKLNLEGRGDEMIRGEGEANLFATEMKLAFANWSKEANTPALASFKLAFEPEQILVNDIALEAADISIISQLAIDRRSATMKSLHVDHLVTTDNQLSMDVATLDIGGYDIDINAKSFDARPFLDDLLNTDSTEGQPAIKLDLRAENLVLLNDVLAKNVTLTAEDMGGYWASAALTGALDNGTPISFNLSKKDNDRVLILEAADAGRMVLGSGLFINAQGGQLKLTADLTGIGKKMLVKGLLEIDDFRLVKSSSLVQAIAQAKGEDIDKLLNDGGMSFNELNLPFTIDEEVIDFPKSIANGSSIGFTMEGQISRDLKKMNINGVVIPAYALNSLISNIPLVGNLLVGGKGEGLFAIPYRISGSTKNPEVKANAAAAIAPGFLRGLFEGSKGKIDKLKPDAADKKTTPNNNQRR